jgi:hypothetical protein
MSNYNQLSPLSAYQRNVYSQLGEDGIIEEILNRISGAIPSSNWCVEFGAWDGMHLSNTYNLIKNKGFKGVLIEGDPSKHELLCRNIPSPDVVKVCAFVSFAGESTLERILERTPIPHDFDVLSIDIDGCDYFILESLDRFKARVVCIEYNSTIPNEVEFVQPKDFSIKQGASARSVVQLAESKGYALVAATPCNLIFVRADLKGVVIGAASPRLSDLRDDTQFKTYVYSGYDGTLFVSGEGLPLPWHGVSVKAEGLQQLPRYLRRFPDDYTILQKIFFRVLLAFKSSRWFRTTVAGSGPFRV